MAAAQGLGPWVACRPCWAWARAEPGCFALPLPGLHFSMGPTLSRGTPALTRYPTGPSGEECPVLKLCSLPFSFHILSPAFASVGMGLIFFLSWKGKLRPRRAEQLAAGCQDMLGLGPGGLGLQPGARALKALPFKMCRGPLGFSSEKPASRDRTGSGGVRMGASSPPHMFPTKGGRWEGRRRGWCQSPPCGHSWFPGSCTGVGQARGGF